MADRWQHVSQLKAIAFFFLQKIVFKKRNNLFLGLVTHNKKNLVLTTGKLIFKFLKHLSVLYDNE
jgi:hypothetical protein